MKKQDTTTITIAELKIITTTVRIVGTSPLIVHRWSVKAKREMLDSMMGKTIKIKGKAREAKNPVADFIQSAYWMTPEPTTLNEEGFEQAIASGAHFGFPATAIKQATISAAYRTGKTKDMASLRGAFFIQPDDPTDPDGLVEIKGCTPVMREDMVHVGMGKPDIRHRAEFPSWYMDLKIEYDANGMYTIEQIVNLLNIGGFACGIGEWRPERNGRNGMYKVAATEA